MPAAPAGVRHMYGDVQSPACVQLFQQRAVASFEAFSPHVSPAAQVGFSLLHAAKQKPLKPKFRSNWHQPDSQLLSEVHVAPVLERFLSFDSHFRLHRLQP